MELSPPRAESELRDVQSAVVHSRDPFSGERLAKNAATATAVAPMPRFAFTVEKIESLFLFIFD